jgi:hypothetical protein
MTAKLTKEGKIWLVLLSLGPASMAFLKSCAVGWATLGNYLPIMWFGGGIFLAIETFYENLEDLKKYEPLIVFEALTAVSWLVIGAAFAWNITSIIDFINGYHAMYLSLGMFFMVLEVFGDL